MSNRIDTASRFIHASPSDVYAAFADSNAMEQWLPPTNMTGTMLHFDFREGQSYRMRLTYQRDDQGRGKTSKNADEVEVRLLRLIVGEYIEQAVTFASDDPAFAGTMRMIWTFTPETSGTLVTVRAEDVPPGITQQDHEIGMRATLEQLASYLSASRDAY